MSDQLSPEAEIRQSLKRCSEPTIQAALDFQESRDPALVAPIVLGIIERFLEPDRRDLLRGVAADEARLVEDLGIDSLLMVEIVMLVEEVLSVQIDNEELRHLRSVGDIKTFLQAKIQGLPVDAPENLLTYEQVLATMPHQPPFLFLQEARINGQRAEGSYTITGEEDFLEGHFKGQPVFPASLMLEALGQLAVLYLLRSHQGDLPDNLDPQTVLFVSCDGVRCHRMCQPGETLQMSVELLNLRAPLAQFEGAIQVQGQRVARVETLSLTFAPQSASSTPSSLA